MTRCGSTMVANALRAAEDVVVLSEPLPLLRLMGMATRPSRYWSQRCVKLLGRLTAVFAQYQEDTAKKIVIKCASEEIAALAAIRIVWPAVPCLVLIRNPLEVLVSNIRNPPKWVNLAERRNWFGRSIRDVEFEGIVDYVAWVIGRFCSEALPALDMGCKVIDYERLSPEAVREVAADFGLRFSPDGWRLFQQAFLTHSKNNKDFESDSEEKRLAATEAMKRGVNRWVEAPYHELLRRATMEADRQAGERLA